MGIGSWWKRLRKREDDAAIERAQERVHETHEERHATDDYEGMVTDERAAERCTRRTSKTPSASPRTSSAARQGVTVTRTVCTALFA